MDGAAPFFDKAKDDPTFNLGGTKFEMLDRDSKRTEKAVAYKPDATEPKSKFGQVRVSTGLNMAWFQ